MLGFDKSDITDESQHEIILKERVNKIFVVYDVEEFVTIEKDIFI